jgi:hypothetical protein
VRDLSRGRAPWLAVVAGLAWAGIGHAQAWLPDGGSADVSLTYVDSWVTKHYLSAGTEVDVGHIRTFTYGLAGDYSPTDRLMFSASLPLIESGYHGAFPHPSPTDDGSYHSTFTDVRLEMHYQLTEEPLAIAPYVAYVFPTHTYYTFGHAAPGLGLDETWVGVAVGKTLDRWIPRTFIESRFTYAFVEAVQHIAHDRENVEVDVGYFFTPKLSLQGFWHWQQTLGGIELPVPPKNPLYVYHDQLGRANHTAVGFTTSWTRSDHSEYSFTYSTDIMGRNGHKVDSAWSLAYDYRFGRN